MESTFNTLVSPSVSFCDDGPERSKASHVWQGSCLFSLIIMSDRQIFAGQQSIQKLYSISFPYCSSTTSFALQIIYISRPWVTAGVCAGCHRVRLFISGWKLIHVYLTVLVSITPSRTHIASPPSKWIKDRHDSYIIVAWYTIRSSRIFLFLLSLLVGNLWTWPHRRWINHSRRQSKFMSCLCK